MSNRTPTLSEIGRALYGRDWQTELAEALTEAGYPVTDRTVRRWAKDEPPAPKWAEPIAELVAERRKELERLG